MKKVDNGCFFPAIGKNVPISGAHNGTQWCARYLARPGTHPAVWDAVNDMCVRKCQAIVMRSY